MPDANDRERDNLLMFLDGVPRRIAQTDAHDTLLILRPKPDRRTLPDRRREVMGGRRRSDIPLVSTRLGVVGERRGAIGPQGFLATPSVRPTVTHRVRTESGR